MPITKLKLVMTFETAMGNRVSLSVDDPKSGLTQGEVAAAMDVIIANSNGNFAYKNGDNFVKKIEAKLVETDTQEFDVE